MAGKDRIEKYRAILGVKEGATLDELKRAFRRKASALHPDVNPNDPVAAEAFKKVTAAYEYLRARLRSEPVAATKQKSMTEAMSAAYRPAREPESTTAATTLPLEELVIRMRHSENPYVRLHAVRAIASISGRESAWALVQALSDTDRGVRAEAIDALGNKAARIAVIPLLTMHKEADNVLKTQIETALEQISSPMAVRFLKKIGKAPSATEPDIKSAGAGDGPRTA